jgi:hypothetical protein
MTESFELGNEKYKLEGNPTLGTVRKVQSMQTDLLLDYLDEDDIRSMDSIEDEGEIVQKIIDKSGLDAFEELQWKRSMLENVQTVSLAADHCFDSDDFENMPAKDYKTLMSDAEDALGGSATDFFEELGIGMSFSAEEMDGMRET